jgi:hypothetical protein
MRKKHTWLGRRGLQKRLASQVGLELGLLRIVTTPLAACLITVLPLIQSL